MDRAIQGCWWACDLGRFRLRGLGGVLAPVRPYQEGFGED